MRDEGEFFFGDEETLDAVKKFEDSIRKKKGLFLDVTEFESVIDYYLNSDDSRRASEAIDIARRIHPNSSEIQLRKAELLLMENKHSEALAILNTINSIDPLNGDIHLAKGQAFLELKMFAEAEDSFQRAIELATDEKSYMYFRIAGLYLSADDYSAAAKYLSQSEILNPDNLGVLFDLAFCYDQLDEFAQSENYYNKYLDINPFSSSVWFNLGILLTRKDEFEKAIEAYDFAIAIDPSNSSAYFNKANTLATIEGYSAAVNCFQEFLKLEPENPQIYCSIGECYEKMKEFDKALKSYRKSIALNPAMADAYYGIGVVMIETKQYNLALDMIAKAKALDPENYDYWLGYAKVKYEMKYVEEALDAYKEAITLYNDEPDAYLGVAEILLYQNRLDEVETFCSSVVLKFPDVPMFKVIRAAAQYKTGNIDLAVSTLRNAKVLDPLSVDDFISLVSLNNESEFLKRVNFL